MPMFVHNFTSYFHEKQRDLLGELLKYPQNEL